MNFIYRVTLTAVFFIITFSAKAQDNGAADLIKQGVQLNEQGKYDEAIDKYKSALKIDPDNIQANYELAFSLFTSGKGNDGIPYIEKTIKGSTSPSLIAASYDLLGSIYDQGHQSQKAIESYQAGIKVSPTYQRLHFNLGIAYFRNKQYTEAEASAIEAIRIDPKHASSQRLYALVTFHQNKRVCALMGFCSLLLLEPKTQRSAEAYANIQHILQGGLLKDDNGRTTVIISPKDNQENSMLNTAISMTVLSAQTKKLAGMDLLEYELKHIFSITGELAEKKADKSFFDKFFVDYFYKLEQSNNMPAFARLISLSANKDENTKWMNDNAQLVKELDNWIAATPRSF
ncbi:MAG: tetratricopeptide repeat protein [Mucilaginibacter sp.]|nr:tetratricopeptide repeat protein [Mucilaginibacter sp.]